jgi:hypothetical protein
MRRRGEPFEDGTPLKSLTVLSVKSEAQRVCGWVYRVKYAACGHEGDLCHKTVLQRQSQDRSGRCPECVAEWKKGALAQANAHRRRARKGSKNPEHDAAWAHKLWA